MRNIKLVTCLMLLAAPLTLAEPATQPATESSTTNLQPPATQPAQAERGTILVLPLAESSGTTAAWLSHGIQQDVMADLARTTNSRVIAPAAEPAARDAAEAVAAGKKAGATLAIYGQYQTVGNQIRVTGQIVDVANGQGGGSFSATGQMSNLFPVEDSITSQLLHELPPGWLIVALPPANQSGAAAGLQAVPPAPPQVSTQMNTELPQYYSYTYPDYSTPYNADSYYYGESPYYWYGVPYYGPDIWFYGGWGGFHHHFGYRGWDGWHGHDVEHGVPNGFGHAPAAHAGGGFHGGGSGGHGGGGHR